MGSRVGIHCLFLHIVIYDDDVWSNTINLLTPQYSSSTVCSLPYAWQAGLYQVGYFSLFKGKRFKPKVKDESHCVSYVPTWKCEKITLRSCCQVMSLEYLFKVSTLCQLSICTISESGVSAKQLVWAGGSMHERTPLKTLCLDLPSAQLILDVFF